MKRTIVTTLVVFVCFLLQSTVFHALDFGGVIPNLLIIVTSSFGFMCGKKNGLLVGFFCGLLYDIFYGNILGYYALIYMYIGFANGFFRAIFYPEDIKLPLFLISFSDFSYNLLCYLLLFFLKGKFQITTYFSNVIIPELIYTILITIVLYPIIFLINNKLEESEKENAKKFV